MPTYRIERITGLTDSSRRAVRFLECSPKERDLNARDYFLNASEKIQREFLSRFGHWLSGQRCDKYFHGWPNHEKRKHCFVFKKEAASAHQRLYGFLAHPKQKDPGFQVCVLVVHGQKADETDPTLLSVVERYRGLSDVQAALKVALNG